MPGRWGSRLGTFGLFTAGLVLWLAYSLIIGDLPIIVSNVVTVALNALNLVQMVKCRRRQ